VRCPRCGHLDSRVVDSRGSPGGDAIRRRRQCSECNGRFTTYERVEESLPLVIKKDGRREAFDRAKLASGLEAACQKRSVSAEEIEGVVEAVERGLLEGGARELSSSRIGEAVMSRLRNVDDVAYVRFASVYRSFKDIDEFMDELSSILKNRGGFGDG